MLSKRIAEYLNNKSGIADITAYAESFPAPKATFPHIVAVVSAGRIQSTNGKTQSNNSKRIIVSGSASLAMSKATEIYDYFFPKKLNEYRSFDAGEYSLFFAKPEGNEPTFISNVGNIFLVAFVVDFLVARDS